MDNGKNHRISKVFARLEENKAMVACFKSLQRTKEREAGDKDE